MLTILQISDVHFGPPYLPHVGEALLRFIPSLNADAIVVNGDLTQRATEEQFQQARDFLERLPDVPRLVVPGNHDVPLYRFAERLLRPHQNYQRYISQQLNTVLRVPGAVLVGLDSTAPRRAISNGRITGRQLDFCSQAFEEAAEDDLRVVVAHHHFAPAPDYLRDQTMPRARRAMTRFGELGVDLVMGGHLHRAYIGDSLDFFPGKDRDRGIIIAQSGTSTSRRGRGREREKNSFNLIQATDTTVHITHFMYFKEPCRFEPFSHHTFPRPGRISLDPSHVMTKQDVAAATEDEIC